MANYLSLVLLWLLFFALTFAAAVWSSSPSPLPPRAQAPLGGICKSRVEIFGYGCEEHTVTTKDGYILSLQRITSGRHSNTSDDNGKKIPVLLQHGVLMDGVTWLMNSPGDSLGYMLADSGYDVWIANGRGTRFSRGHVMSSLNDSAYWDWSWDELVAYDLPAVYLYVYRNSGFQKMHYIGHSLGTLMAIASFSMKRLTSMTRSAALLCPIAFLDKVESPIARSIAGFFLADAYYWLGLNEFRIMGKPVHTLLQMICSNTGINCYDLLTSFTGQNCCLNPSAVAVLLDNEPQPTSTKTVVHMAQMLRTGTITKFDYGDVNMNMKHYGQQNPPAYNVSDIPNDIPIFFGHGGRDSLSDVGDVKHLLATLASHGKKNMRVLYQASYAHGDFIMGINAKRRVYEPLMSFLNIH